MKYVSKFFFTAIGLVFLFSACNKVKDQPFYNNGKAPVLSSSATAIAASQADSMNNVVTFSWSDPKYATDLKTVKFIIEIDTEGSNFSNPNRRTVTDVLGASYTARDINNILLGYGLSLGVSHSLDVRVVSSYANNNEQYNSNVVNIMVTPYGDSSVLTASATSVVCELNTASSNSVDFAWSKSFNGYVGAVTYTLQYDSAGKNFVAPTEIAIGASIYNKSLTQGEINETALNSKIAGGSSGTVEYRIKSTTALGATVYSNAVLVTIQSYLPLLRFYLPGGYQGSTGNGNDWDPSTAPEFIRDLRPDALNDLYYMYIYLPAGSQFKVTQGRSWDVNYGGSGGTLSSTGGNLSVAADGVYRITISRKTLTYDIREGRMGFVGGATGAGWNPPNVFPSYAMGAPSLNLFVGITDLAADGWKLIDNNQWNSGGYGVDNSFSYGSTGASGSTMELNGANFPNITTAGKYRVIWDGRNVDNIKYEMSPATEMRVVGDGMDGVNAWDPGTSPQMTYLGSGKWQATLTLIAGKDIKFVAGNAWGAFDYEDNSGGSTATGTPRKIKWEGGDNFKTPAVTGSYTITLDENNQVVTITP